MNICCVCVCDIKTMFHPKTVQQYLNLVVYDKYEHSNGEARGPIIADSEKSPIKDKD